MDAAEWVRRVNVIIAAYRGTADTTIDLDQALRQLRALGVLEGDALRWLGNKGKARA